MNRQELEAACLEVGYEPEADDRDVDLWMVLQEAHYFDFQRLAA